MAERPGSKTPEQVGPYRVVSQIGRGGMAVVYLAKQPVLARSVALKELAPFLAGDPALAQRFIREARVASSLNHPNVVTVFDFLEQDGVPYIAMEYLERGSLRPFVGRMSLAQIAGVLEGLLAALSHAEVMKIVHRDIKPENLLVTGDGGIKIADFGIAKAMQQVATDEMLTPAGATVGTPAYMAPEQAMAQALGPWTDLYQAGIVAYELLSGDVPFRSEGAALAVLMQHITDPVPPLPAGTNPALEAWVQRMLAKEPADRPPNARVAWTELEDIVVEAEGPLWRRDARLGEHEPTVEHPQPLTPARFSSWQDYVAAPAPRPAAGTPPTPPPPPRAATSGYVDHVPDPRGTDPPREAPPPEPEPEPREAVAPPEPEPAAPGVTSGYVDYVPDPRGADPPGEAPPPEPREEDAPREPEPRAAAAPREPEPREVAAPREPEPREAVAPPEPPSVSPEPPAPEAPPPAAPAAPVPLTGFFDGAPAAEPPVPEPREVVSPPPVAPPTLAPTSPPSAPDPPRRRTVVLAFGALGLLAAAIVAFVLLLDGGDGGGDPTPTPTATATATPTADPASAGPFTVGDTPDGIAIGAGAVWAVGSGDGTLTRIDPTSGDTTSVDVGRNPDSVVVAFSSVWVSVTGANKVVRLSATDQPEVQQEFDVGSRPEGLASSGNAIWVANSGDGTLSQIVEATGDVRPVEGIGGEPVDVAVGAGAVWVADASGARVARVDGGTRRLVATIRGIGPNPRAVTIVGRDVWVATADDGRAWRIDADADATTGSVRVGGQPRDIATDGARLFVTDRQGDRLVEVDPQAMRVTDRETVEDGPLSVAVDARDLWVTRIDANEVSRIARG